MEKKYIRIIGIAILCIGIFLLLQSITTNSWNKNNSTNNISPSLPPATPESPTFEDTVWIAASIENSKPINENSMTVQFNDQGRITGSDGCNTFNGSYQVDGSTLSINQNLISTERACEKAVMEQANKFTSLLLASTSYTLGDGVMVLLQGDSDGLSFTGSSNSLAKTSWNVTGYNNGKQAVVSPILNTNPTIVFRDDVTISGDTGCNTYSGKYSVNGNTIMINTLASSGRECFEPEGIMEQETSLLTYLQKADTWLIQGNQLSLRTAEDQLAVSANNSTVTSN